MEEMEEASTAEINFEDMPANGEKGRNDKAPGVSREGRGIWNCWRVMGKVLKDSWWSIWGHGVY